MNAKIVASVMLFLFLVSMVSPILNVRGVSSFSGNSPLNNSSAGPTPDSVNNNRIAANSLEKEKPQPYTGDAWDFSNYTKWNSLAYADGNKTRLIVGINNSKPNSVEQIESMAKRQQAEIVNRVNIGSQLNAVVVEVAYEKISAFVNDVRQAGLADYVEPNLKVQSLFTPNDPFWNLQWGPQKIQADWAWNTTRGSNSVLVAVVDTGIDYSHPDLAANYVPFGYNWVQNNADPLDDFGHGTHCAGIIAAVLNNSVGVAGTAQVRIMAEKVLDAWGYGYWDWVANGIVHAADQGANIISMSLGGYGDSELVHAAVKYASDAGVLIVAAAGNDNTNMKSYPAAYEEVVAVAATDQSDNKAYFSNWGDWIELAAPGVNIYSTMPTYPVTMTNYYGFPMNYAYMSGTSMACPFAAGVAALAWSRYPNGTREFLRQWLRMTADDLGDPGFDEYYGYGRVNARTTVERSPPQHDLVALEWKIPPYIKLGKTGTITATVLNFGASDETNVQMELFANDTIVNSIQIGSLAAGAKTTVSLNWTPALEGLYNLTFYVVPVLGETEMDNNVLSKNTYSGYPIIAEVLHSYGNVLGQSIINWQAITNDWYTFGNKMVYIDYTSLNKDGITYEDLAATDADVLIISCAAISYNGWEFTDSEIEAITRYTHEGHGLVATAGTLYEGVPNNNKLGSLLGLNESATWTATWTDLMHVLNVTHPVFKDVPNPIVFPQVQTAVPINGRWDSSVLIGGKYLALGHKQESSAVTYRGLVYISPWLEIVPPYYRHHLQLLYNAIIWSRYQKPAHELVVKLQAPTYMQPGESTQLNVTLENQGLSNETNVELQLFIDGIIVNSAIVPVLLPGETYQVSYPWTPSEEKRYNLTGYSPPVDGEEDTFNNVDTVFLFVRPTRYVLFDSSHDWDGDSLTGNYLLLDKLLISNGFVVDELRTGPINSQLLSKYDILILMDPEYDILPSEITDIQSWVLTGGGLLAIPDGGYPLTMNLLLSPYGVKLTGNAGGYGTTTEIAAHNITENVKQIYIDWIQEITVNSPSTPLAWTAGSSNHLCFLSASKDRDVVVLSDSNVMDNYGLKMVDNELLMLNILNWIGVKSQHNVAVKLTAPAFVESNTSSTLEITVSNRGLNNETNVQMELLINDSVLYSETIAELDSGSISPFTYLWAPTREGFCNVTAFVQPVLGEEMIDDNVAQKNVAVRSVKHILYDRTHGNDYPGMYYQWFLELLGRGYTIDSLYAYPITFEALNGYDVFICAQPYMAYSIDEQSAIQSFVFNGGGLLVIGDDIPTIFTDLTGFAGISWASGGVSGLTTDITPHPVTAGVNSVYLSAPVAIMYANGSARSLVRDPQRNTMLAVSEQPSGKVAGFADEDSLSDYSINRADNMLLANNMIDWLSTPIVAEHDLRVELSVPRSVELGKEATVEFTAKNKGLNTETDLSLCLFIEGSLSTNVSVATLQPGESFTQSINWTATEPSTYNFTAYVSPVPGEENVANNLETALVKIYYVRSYTTSQALSGGDAMGWHADEASWGYTLPFDFPFYGTYYRTIYVSSNGLITFTNGDSDSTNSVQALSHKLAIAVAWANWATYYPFDIYTWTNETYVGIRWNVTAIGPGVLCSFEAVLSSEGIIQLNFGDASGPVSATAGVSDGVGNMLAEEIPYTNHVNTILFLPSLGKRDVAITDIVTSKSQLPLGSSLDVQVTVENKGNFTENFYLTAFANQQNSSSSSATMSPTLIYLDPQQSLLSGSTVTVGYRFNVTARLDDVPGLGTWQTGIYFNGSILAVNRCFEPNWDPEYVFFGQPAVFATDIGKNFVLAGASLLSGENAFNGSGKLCIVEFEVTAIPPQGGQAYSSPLILDNSDTFLLDMNSIPIPALRQNGYYEIQPAPVPGHYPLGPVLVLTMLPGEVRVITFTWNTEGALPGDYMIHAEAALVPGEANPLDNIYYDGIVTVKSLETTVHDVAVINVTEPPSFVYPKWIVRMNVTVANCGNATESFTVTLYCNDSAIVTQPVLGIVPNGTLTLTFEWNATMMLPNQTYALKAVASIVQGEQNTTNNEFMAGQMRIKITGDVNGDGVVNYRDISLAIKAFRSYPGRENWNPDADIRHDNIVDMRDITDIVLNYYKPIPT